MIVDFSDVHHSFVDASLRNNKYRWSLKDTIKVANSNTGVVRVFIDDRGDVEGFYLATAIVDQITLLFIFVNSNVRCGGIGLALIDDLLSIAGKYACTEVLLEVRESNTAAKNLYFRSGFERVGVRKNYYPLVKHDVESDNAELAASREDAELYSYFLRKTEN